MVGVDEGIVAAADATGCRANSEDVVHLEERAKCEKLSQRVVAVLDGDGAGELAVDAFSVLDRAEDSRSMQIQSAVLRRVLQVEHVQRLRGREGGTVHLLSTIWQLVVQMKGLKRNFAVRKPSSKQRHFAKKTLNLNFFTHLNKFSDVTVVPNARR